MADWKDRLIAKTEDVSPNIDTDFLLELDTSADAIVKVKPRSLLALYALLASPALTGNPTAPTQTLGNNTTRLATTAFVAAAVTAGATTIDMDGTLAANSDAVVPSQKAVKTYVNSVVAGLSWKQMVRAATTVAGTLASSFENGDTIDGVVLATGDRILIKNQASGIENGIYVVAASGAPARATDGDSGAELVNASMYVSEGTTNADTQWVCTTNATITVGVTSISFTQFTSANGVSKAAGTDIDTGTDDVKFLTSKAVNDSHNVPDVAPGTSGNILSSNGTDWTSQAPSAIGGIPSGPFSRVRTNNTEDDEFEGTAFDAKWTKGNSASIESYDDHIRSAVYCEHASASSDVSISQAYVPGASNFSLTLLCSMTMSTNNQNITLQASDAGGTNVAEVQMIQSSGTIVRSVKFVAGVFTQLNAGGALSLVGYPHMYLHLQRSGTNSWDMYYSHNGLTWTAVSTAQSITITVAKIVISFGTGGAAVTTRTVLHWLRRDWITLP